MEIKEFSNQYFPSFHFRHSLMIINVRLYIMNSEISEYFSISTVIKTKILSEKSGCNAKNSQIQYANAIHSSGNHVYDYLSINLKMYKV